MHAKTQYLFPTYPSEEGIWGRSKKMVKPIQKQSKEKSQGDSWGADQKSNWYKLENIRRFKEGGLQGFY